MINFFDVAYPVEPVVDKVTTYSIIAISAAVVLVVLVGIAVALKHKKRG